MTKSRSVGKVGKASGVGSRTLLARICVKCSVLKQGEDFRRRIGHSGPYRSSTCKRCEQDGVHSRRKVRAMEQGSWNREFVERAQKETKPFAKRHRFEWTGPEIELLDRGDLTNRQIAEMTGRTYLAVVNARHKHRSGTWKAHRDKTLMKEKGGL